MKGHITKVVADKQFFFIDHDYWCHFNNYNKEPRTGDIVEYEPKTKPDGKKNAFNVKFIESGSIVVEDHKHVSVLPKEYLVLINSGYFDDKDCLKDSLILDWPLRLSQRLGSNPDKNKSSQLRKFYDYCKQREGELLLGQKFESVRTKLLELIPLAQSTKNKGHISEEFYDFIELNLRKASGSAKDFQNGFLPHFQALIAYTIK